MIKISQFPITFHRLLPNITTSGNYKLAAPGNISFIDWSELWGVGKTNYTWIVLASDYKEYMAVTSCINVLGLFKLQVIRILTKSASPTTIAVDAAKKAFTDNGMSTSGLVDTSTKCF
jgi:hypothetical protein